MVLLGGAALTIPAVRSLSRLAGASEDATTAVLCAAAPFLVYNALFGLYPDVLLAAALLGSCAALLRPSFRHSPAVAALAGALAAVAFLAKAYALPVVAVVLTLGAALHLTQHGGASAGRALRQLAVALAAFALLAGAWVAALSASYGGLTVSTSAGFNLGLVSSTSAGNPYNVPGLHPPPRQGAVSAWEEPSRLPIPRRSSAEGSGPDAARDELSHRMGTAVANARIIVGSMLRRGAPIALLALAGLVLSYDVAPSRRRRWPARCSPPASTPAVYCSASRSSATPGRPSCCSSRPRRSASTPLSGTTAGGGPASPPPSRWSWPQALRTACFPAGTPIAR